MTSAEIACAVRSARLGVQDLHDALWQRRTLVKTLAMRQTLHLLPSADFSIYMTAVRNSRMAALLRVMARLGITQRQVDSMNRAVMEALGGGPKTKTELEQEIKPVMRKGLKAWMELSWNAFRPAIIEGLICYGPDRGRQATFVRVDQWLPKQKARGRTGSKACIVSLVSARVWSGGPARSFTLVRHSHKRGQTCLGFTGGRAKSGVNREPASVGSAP